MPVHTTRIALSTRGDAQVVDITDEIRAGIASSNIASGIGCVFVPGSTGAITTIEYEPGCVADLQRHFDEVAPADGNYEHEKRWGDGNGHSHLRSALLGPSLSFPFSNGEPLLGTWQQVIFVDFDNRSRSRELVLQLVGE